MYMMWIGLSLNYTVFACKWSNQIRVSSHENIFLALHMESFIDMYLLVNKGIKQFYSIENVLAYLHMESFINVYCIGQT